MLFLVFPAGKGGYGVGGAGKGSGWKELYRNALKYSLQSTVYVPRNVGGWMCLERPRGMRCIDNIRGGVRS